MRVLQICLKPPHPAIDGGCKAMNAITQGLIDNNIEVKVLAISTPKHPFLKQSIPTEYFKKTKLEHVFINTKVTPLQALKNLTSSKPYNVERFYDKKMEQLIVRTIQKEAFDIVLLESLYVSNYVNAIRKCSEAKIVLRAHNVESALWQRNALQQKGIKKGYVKMLAQQLEQYEQHSLNTYDGIAAITKEDKATLLKMGCTVPVEVFPFGINISDYPLTKAAAEKKVFHIGSMDWLPNQTGIQWLLDKVWGRVVASVPDARLNLAGRKMPDGLKNTNMPNVNVLGEVENAVAFIQNNDIMVVPLLTGGGMRVKIIEGMALGKLVIATTIAAEGIACKHQQNIVIANTPQEMEKALVYYLKHEQQQLEIGKAARKLIEKSYDNKAIVSNLLTFFKHI